MGTAGGYGRSYGDRLLQRTWARDYDPVIPQDRSISRRGWSVSAPVTSPSGVCAERVGVVIDFGGATRPVSRPEGG
jgi:hypothetical protein